MGKLILQFIAVAVLLTLGRRYEWAYWVTGAAIAAAAVLVQVLFAMMFRGSSRHLGAAVIKDDDPLMLAALAEAKQTWPQFLVLFAEHPTTSLVKFRVTTTAGDVENVWGDLLELGDDTATVYLRTPPVGRITMPGPRMSIPRSDIVDWQVMYPDESLRGGFTQQATFRIIERDGGSLSGKLAEQLARYRPLSPNPD